jgi:HlyD family secretion protein
MANSKKRGRILILAVIVLIAAGTAGFVIRSKRNGIITIQTELVSRGNLTEIVVANGKIQPVLQVKISPEVSGEIIDLPIKEGQQVKKGDLILKIKPDFYLASRSQAQASFESAVAGKETADANLRKAQADFKRNSDLFRNHLVSTSTFDEAQAGFDVARAQATSAAHQVEMAQASLASAEDALAKTTIVSPLTGTVSKLNSALGERVVGTATMAGTEVMTVADLNEMEARIDIGENDVVLIQPGQKARLEVDAFKDRKFQGTVTEIANSSTTAGLSSTSGMGTANSQEATKFSVKIRIKEKEMFRPGMSVTAEIETRSRTNALMVPIASVTTRIPKSKDKNKKDGNGSKIEAVAARTNSSDGLNATKGDSKKDAAKPIEVVFLLEQDHVKMTPVKIGISDDTHWEVVEGLKEGQEVISGGYKAISRELEDGKKVKKGVAKEKENENPKSDER